MTKKKPGAKMGQPPKPPDEKRSELIGVLFNPSEHQAVEKAARTAGKRLGTWCREVILAALGHKTGKNNQSQPKRRTSGAHGEWSEMLLARAREDQPNCTPLHFTGPNCNPRPNSSTTLPDPSTFPIGASWRQHPPGLAFRWQDW